jgi:hypothetical protein
VFSHTRPLAHNRNPSSSTTPAPAQNHGRHLRIGRSRCSLGWRFGRARADVHRHEQHEQFIGSACLISDVARAILFKASDVLNDYQSAMCNVYVARACNSNECQRAEDYIETASVHLKSLQDISKLLAAHGVPGEHPRVTELAAEIEDLRR